MPFVGAGLHLIIAVFFAVHVLRSGQSKYWLLLLFFFPLLGSAIYFFAVYYPNDYRMQRQSQKVVTAAEHLLDPGRELREARQAWQQTPTAQNLLRLAHAQLQAGEYAQAAQSYSDCLQGPFANDVDIQLGAARAYVLSGQPTQALQYLELLEQEQQGVRAEEVAILLAQALSANGQQDAARNQFEEAIARFGSFQAYAEYAIWAAQSGDIQTAQQLQGDIERVTAHWDRAQRTLNTDTMQRLTAAYKNIPAAAAT